MVNSFEFTMITTNPSQTKKLGEILAKEILESDGKNRAVLLALEGNLGSGKTTFIQGLGRGLGVREKITSPSFVILKKFQIQHPTFKFFYHIDCYRLRKTEELLELGLREIASNYQNIVAIEWSEKIKTFLKKPSLLLKFVFLDKKRRKITISSPKV